MIAMTTLTARIVLVTSVTYSVNLNSTLCKAKNKQLGEKLCVKHALALPPDSLWTWRMKITALIQIDSAIQCSQIHLMKSARDLALIDIDQ